jgi:choline dehydrogenase-like flavoprotein
MPSVPRANTNISTIMIGEKIANAILSERNPLKHLESALHS